MKIHVLYFAMARDLAGTAQASLELPAAARVTDAVQQILRLHPEMGGMARSLRFAVNEEFVDSSRNLQEGDRLAILPPVSGG